MRFPSDANSSPDCVAEEACVAEAGDEADGAWPLAVAVSPTARIWARIKEAAPISTRVKTANPAIAGKRRNALDAAKIIASIGGYCPHGVEPEQHALQTSLLGPLAITCYKADAKERQNVLSFAALAACPLN